MLLIAPSLLQRAVSPALPLCFAPSSEEHPCEPCSWFCWGQLCEQRLLERGASGKQFAAGGFPWSPLGCALGSGTALSPARSIGEGPASNCLEASPCLPVTHSHAGASLSSLQAALKTAAEMVLVGSLQAEQGGGKEGEERFIFGWGLFSFCCKDDPFQGVPVQHGLGVGFGIAPVAAGGRQL